MISTVTPSMLENLLQFLIHFKHSKQKEKTKQKKNNFFKCIK